MASWSIRRTIWSNAVLGGRRGWVIGWTVVALILSALGGLAAFVSPSPETGLRGMYAVPLAVLATFYWMRFVSGAVRQNSPANARLVPGLNRSVRATTVLAWCATLAPMALFASTFEHGVMGFVVLSVLVSAIGMSRGGRPAGMVIYVLTIAMFIFVGELPGLKTSLATSPAIAVLALASVMLAWVGLRTVFPAGGERHWKLLAGQAKQRASGDQRQTVRLTRGSGWSARVYAVWLRRDLLADAKPAHLLLHALGPYNHRLDFVAPLAVATTFVVVLRLMMSEWGATTEQVGIALAVISSCAVPLVLLQGATFHRLVVSIDTTRGEQALVRLAPRTARSDLLGRSLARQLLGICLREWLACGFFLAGAMLLFGGGRTHLILLATVMAPSLSMTGWALRDHTGRRAGLPFVVMGQTILMAFAGFALFWQREDLFAWTTILAVVLGGAAVIVYARWRTMVGAPTPFPAGRFS